MPGVKVAHDVSPIKKRSHSDLLDGDRNIIPGLGNFKDPFCLIRNALQSGNCLNRCRIQSRS
jgi:hypothetical protein